MNIFVFVKSCSICLFSLVLAGFSLFASMSALGADCETAGDGPGATNISCDEKIYTDGITFNNTDGLTLILDNNLTSLKPVTVTSRPLTTNRNPLAIQADHFNKITTTSGSGTGKGALYVLANAKDSARIAMQAGTIVATGTDASGIRAEVSFSKSDVDQRASIELFGGSIQSEESTALYALVDGSPKAGAEVLMHGGRLSGYLGIESEILPSESPTALNVHEAKVVMDGGTMDVTQTGITATHKGISPKAKASVLVMGDDTRINAQQGILVHGGGIAGSQATFSAVVGHGAQVTGSKTAINIDSQAQNAVAIRVRDESTKIIGNVIDGAGDSTVLVEGQVIGDIKTGAGNDAITITSSAQVEGGIEMEGGEDKLFIETNQVNGMTTLDGGGDITTDHLHFSNTRVYAYAPAKLMNWKSINFSNGRPSFSGGTLKVGKLNLKSGTLTLQDDLNVTGAVKVNAEAVMVLASGRKNIVFEGIVENSGVMSLVNGVAGDVWTMDVYSTTADSVTLKAPVISLDVQDATAHDQVRLGASVAGVTSGGVPSLNKPTIIEVNNLGLPDMADIRIPLIVHQGSTSGRVSAESGFSLKGGAIELPHVTYTLQKNAMNGWDLVSQAMVFQIGGRVSGLDSGQTIRLYNNGGDVIDSENGAFLFPTSLATGSNYMVTMDEPLNKTCTLTNAGGSVNAAPIDDVMVVCEHKVIQEVVFNDGFEADLP